MNYGLFFIPILTRAFDGPDRPAALTAAVNRIIELGRERHYQRGYAQFLRWVDEVRRAMEPNNPPLAALSRTSASAQNNLCDLVIERDGQAVATVSVGRASAAQVVHDIIPGQYRVRTSTGWLLLTCTLVASDVSWCRHSDSPVPLAADTGDSAPKPACRFRHRASGITLSLFRGLDRGLLEVRYQPSGDEA